MKNLENAHISHELQTSSASVVVTTTSSHVHAEGAVDDPMDEDLLRKPRGFFADQFEVLNFDVQTGRQLCSRAHRIVVILTHITKGLAQNSGAKLMVTSTHLYLEQVCWGNI